MPSFYEAHGDCSEINEALCLHYTWKLFNYTYLENLSVTYLSTARLTSLIREAGAGSVWMSLAHAGCGSAPERGLWTDWADQVSLFVGPSGTPLIGWPHAPVCWRQSHALVQLSILPGVVSLDEASLTTALKWARWAGSLPPTFLASAVILSSAWAD